MGEEIQKILIQMHVLNNIVYKGTDGSYYGYFKWKSEINEEMSLDNRVDRCTLTCNNDSGLIIPETERTTNNLPIINDFMKHDDGGFGNNHSKFDNLYNTSKLPNVYNHMCSCP